MNLSATSPIADRLLVTALDMTDNDHVHSWGIIRKFAFAIFFNLVLGGMALVLLFL
jgi:hypothetical protein